MSTKEKDRMIKEQLANTAALNGTPETLTGYQNQVFVELGKLNLSDAVALDLIALLSSELTNYEERHFTPEAAAKTLFELAISRGHPRVRVDEAIPQGGAVPLRNPLDPTSFEARLQVLAKEASSDKNPDNIRAIGGVLHATLAAMAEGREMDFMIHVTNWSIHQQRRLTAHRN